MSTYTKVFPYFTAETLEQTQEGWRYVVVGIFQHDKDGTKTLLGKFERNYSTNFNNFSWCQKGDRYFALYSPSYACTRVMEIFPCVGFTDIGGEEKSSDGFCPTDLYIVKQQIFLMEQFHVPSKVKDWSDILVSFPGARLIETGREPKKGRQQLYYPDGGEIRVPNGKFNTIRVDGQEEYKVPRYDCVYGPERDLHTAVVELPPHHAFVAGCYWGDDHSWKIQYVDVSRIDEGIIKREERFGYIELPDNLTLEQAINVDDLEDGFERISISIKFNFDLKTGSPRIDDDDLYEKIVAGRKNIEDDMAKWAGYKERQQKVDEDLHRRWEEQGERIRAEVEASGGKIGH